LGWPSGHVHDVAFLPLHFCESTKTTQASSKRPNATHNLAFISLSPLLSALLGTSPIWAGPVAFFGRHQRGADGIDFWASEASEFFTPLIPLTIFEGQLSALFIAPSVWRMLKPSPSQPVAEKKEMNTRKEAQLHALDLLIVSYLKVLHILFAAPCKATFRNNDYHFAQKRQLPVEALSLELSRRLEGEPEVAGEAKRLHQVLESHCESILQNVFGGKPFASWK